MKSLTIRLPDILAKRIEEESIARKVSKSVIVRERLDSPPYSTTGPQELKEILEECWAIDVPELPKFRSPKKQKLAEIIRAKKSHRR